MRVVDCTRGRLRIWQPPQAVLQPCGALATSSEPASPASPTCHHLQDLFYTAGLPKARRRLNPACQQPPPAPPRTTHHRPPYLPRPAGSPQPSPEPGGPACPSLLHPPLPPPPPRPRGWPRRRRRSRCRRCCCWHRRWHPPPLAPPPLPQSPRLAAQGIGCRVRQGSETETRTAARQLWHLLRAAQRSGRGEQPVWQEHGQSQGAAHAYLIILSLQGWPWRHQGGQRVGMCHTYPPLPAPSAASCRGSSGPRVDSAGGKLLQGLLAASWGSCCG